MTDQRHASLLAIWLGLFAMLMIHLGPLISAAQALAHSSVAVATTHTEDGQQIHVHVHADHHAAPAQHLNTESSVLAAETGEQAVDYHALMGHHRAPAGAPQWLANLDMCGYCDLLTVSPPLVLAVLLFLPVTPHAPVFAAQPQPPRYLAVARSLSLPRAPPIPVLV